jgi:hypothetical protein
LHDLKARFDPRFVGVHSFFSGRYEATAAMWSWFASALDRYQLPRRCRPFICDEADVFSALLTWFIPLCVDAGAGR